MLRRVRTDALWILLSTPGSNYQLWKADTQRGVEWLAQPQSSPGVMDLFASFSQSMLPSLRAIKPSKLVAINTEHLATIANSSGTQTLRLTGGTAQH